MQGEPTADLELIFSAVKPELANCEIVHYGDHDFVKDDVNLN